MKTRIKWVEGMSFVGETGSGHAAGRSWLSLALALSLLRIFCSAQRSYLLKVNGKIVEHWDVLQVVPGESANGNSMF